MIRNFFSFLAIFSVFLSSCGYNVENTDTFLNAQKKKKLVKKSNKKPCFKLMPLIQKKLKVRVQINNSKVVEATVKNFSIETLNRWTDSTTFNLSIPNNKETVSVIYLNFPNILIIKFCNELQQCRDTMSECRADNVLDIKLIKK